MIEVVPKRKLYLLSGRSHLQLSEDIASHLKVELSLPNLVDFANGEIRPRFQESVRGADVFIFQSHCRTPGRSVNDSLMEHWLMIDAAKRASAKRITAVCPYYGYSRQDRKSKGREPISARMVSDFFLTAGADRIMSVDLHSGQIQGFFDGPVDHLTAVPVLTSYLREHASGDFVMVAPDTGRTKVAEQAARHLFGGVDVASVYKRRPKDGVNQVQALDVMGHVKGKMCVLIDDMIDTAGTICAAADILIDKGATEVWAMATHAVLSDPAVDRLKNSQITRVVVTDTLPLPSEKQIDKIEVCSVAPMFADAINAVFEDGSVSQIFGGENQT
ncbi:MAG: ribose-phosphate pyrophosphokinae [Acidimicrobiaceae bacterium]|nr:ribose-phosphate pyrophosphokinae [Acidimicrobiaceae bacterium]MDQ1365752.1 ribose-phosphate pyrophosphokinae [Acidimicrobiaceae bacterium]MDQ1370706.1 ribose-phosphate pyrophosphokinae [Acidimicrobiaceae bacterium]MDQ1377730.1 ribose-phosphate pyrophosphokinae [Acidimicrobiaceae bacterium]MDQ1398364.1 ribose-phosphate pyrophosphokinae [Acidimicrobiaceae bacterium]